ncbi:MAG: hypothetical protein NC395_07705 [Prevotella sp.]|nr:hypothetical protein [Prevotella sp.]
MDKFFGVSIDELQNASQEEFTNLLLNREVTEYAFGSCGVAKGKGFSGNPIILNIYAPRGTQMMYAETFSAFGNGSGNFTKKKKYEETTFELNSRVVISCRFSERGDPFIPQLWVIAALLIITQEAGIKPAQTIARGNKFKSRRNRSRQIRNRSCFQFAENSFYFRPHLLNRIKIETVRLIFSSSIAF